MGSLYEVDYHYLVAERDIPRLDSFWRKEIKMAIEKKLATTPETFGEPLRRSLKGYRKLRVGDYRVVFRIEKQTVKILIIEHHSVIYREVYKRVHQPAA